MNDGRPDTRGAAIGQADIRRAGVRASALRVLALCLAVAVVIFVSGAARGGWAAFGQLATETMAGGCFGLAAGRWLVPESWYRTRLWAAALLIALVVSAPLALVVFIFLFFLQHEAPSVSLALHVAPQVFLTSLVMTSLAFLVRRPAADRSAAEDPGPVEPPRFLARLPARLRGADLYAVESEDHYLRLHTSLGEDLILMRLADAIAELEGLQGAQTHRSWWVARDGFVAAERGEGRAVLTLKDGAKAPVSRAFAPSLRAAGWF